MPFLNMLDFNNNSVLGNTLMTNDSVVKSLFESTLAAQLVVISYLNIQELRIPIP